MENDVLRVNMPLLQSIRLTPRITSCCNYVDVREARDGVELFAQHYAYLWTLDVMSELVTHFRGGKTENVKF